MCKCLRQAAIVSVAPCFLAAGLSGLWQRLCLSPTLSRALSFPHPSLPPSLPDALSPCLPGVLSAQAFGAFILSASHNPGGIDEDFG